LDFGRKPAIAVLLLTSALMAAGCDDNEDEQGATIPTGPAETAVQPTAPTATEPAAPAEPTTPTEAAKPGPATPPSEAQGGAPTCATGEAIRNLKFTGIGCEAAAAVTAEWESQIDQCNTIDDPASPEGYLRRCEVRGFECTARRDVRSDARTVSCRGGSSQVRFTWAP
jgi:hypothetical protein